MLETVEVKEQPIVVLKDYEKTEDNKILEGLSDEDYIKVINYFNEKFPIFYVKKSDWNEDRDDLMQYSSGDYWIFINPLCRKDIFGGKIDIVKNLCEKNFKFLDHMFRYNQSLSSFGEILENGKFEVLEQYDKKIIWHYFKDNHNSYTEKQGNYVGHLESKSKLDYFPTNYEIQYKSLPYVTNVVMRDINYIRKSTVKFIEKYIGKIENKSNVYRELIRMGRYDIIDEVFKIEWETDSYKNKDSSDKIVVADLFAGEGEWLNTFKKLAPFKETYILANEIEKNRFLSCKSKKFNNVIWGAYEELEDKIPKKLIDVMLFNPPYGETDQERNVDRFLKMLIKNKYMERYSRVIGVFNEKDFNLIRPRLVRECDVHYAFKLQDSKSEAERLKQVCVIFTIREVENSEYYLRRVEENLDEYLKSEYYCNLATRRNYYDLKNINARFDAFNVFKNPNLYKSDINSESWKSFMNEVTIETFQGKTIKLAEKPRNIGAAANIISSGLINGEVEGEHGHCIAAGITEQISKAVDEETGNIIVTKKSAPFLSVLTGGNIVQITQVNNDPVTIDSDGTVIVA